MISAQGVVFGYGRTDVLSGVALRADRGRVVGLIGPNGSGKTTLLRTLYGALAPRAGLIRLDEDPIDSLGVRQLATRVAVVSQEAAGEIPITAEEMVLLGRLAHRSGFDRVSGEDRQIAADALARVGGTQLAGRDFGSLSGGEKQRVLIARSLAQQADHLLLDEPTNHLDVRYQHEILHLIRRLGITTVIVLHDLNLAARYCDEVVLMHRGAVVRDGPPDRVLTPEVLEPVYEIDIDRVSIRGEPHLVFVPRPDPAEAP